MGIKSTIIYPAKFYPLSIFIKLYGAMHTLALNFSFMIALKILLRRIETKIST